MKRQHLFSIVSALAVLAVLLAASLPASAQSPTPTPTPYSPPPGFVYTVRYGDTVDSIAAGFGISVQALMQANGLSSRYLYAGQRLNIPSNYAPPNPSPIIVYTVQWGDTLYSIARRFGVSVYALTSANRLYNPNFIYTGMRLLIPGATPIATPVATPTPFPPLTYQTYIVQPGDMLYRIALGFGTTVYALMIANNIPNPNLIFVGTRLIIPTVGPISSPTPLPTFTPTRAVGKCPTITPAVLTPSAFVSNVTMALGTVGDQKDPVNPTTVFSTTAIVHAVVAIQNAPENSKFKAAWFISDVGDPAPCNLSISTTEVVASGTRNIDFTLTPTNWWLAGFYRVEISVNGILDRIVKFEVH